MYVRIYAYCKHKWKLSVTDAPSNVSATVLTACSVVVTWNTFPVSSGITGYIISYTAAALYTSGGSVTVNDVNATSYIFTNLEEGTTYTITIQATSSSGMSDNSNEEVSATTKIASK